ncbi:DUF3261 domain-containing protein [Acinetobacter ihumii]|uniref:DUF3261 domain-containing protein n=1 Tax=Acinetobacter ihumii TaxID=2483802 RepID=UPI001031950C|nr:DUF3261 domain-containing protein [Acinetobacter ihumii]
MRNIYILLLSVILMTVTACQQMMPKAAGLAFPAWQQQKYQRQDQVEVQWRGQSFSFLLYQQQKGQILELIALSLTGQPLFQIEYDGQHIQVKQRIEQMRLLPFEFLVRDILLATYPDFSQQQATINPALIQDQIYAAGGEIYIQKKLVLKIQYLSKDQMELENVQVPYQMTFSPIENTLQSNQ